MMEIVVTLLFLLFTMINVNEIIQKHFAMSGGDFHASVICGGFYKKMFGILTHKFMVTYVEHETINYKATIEVDHIIIVV